MVDAAYVPKIAGEGKDMHVVDWSAFDKRFEKYFTGQAFQDCPRKGVPLTHFYLPFSLGWPSDFNNYSGRLRLNQRVSQRFGLYGQYYQIYRDYDDSRIRPEVDPDYMVYAPSAGLFYQFDPQTTASFGLGWFYQQIQNGEDEQGPYLAADVNRLWSYGRSTLRTRASSGIDSTDFSSDARGFERYGQIELIGRHDFTREFFGDASLRYRYSDYINSDDDVVDHRYTAEAGLGYRVTRWMTLRLAYQFNKLDSENTTDDYEQHRVYATVTLQPEQPWRW